MHACMQASKHAYKLHVIFEGLQNHVWTKGFTAHCCAVRSAKESRGPQKESRGPQTVEALTSKYMLHLKQGSPIDAHVAK